jgi:translocation and assembly module TamA
MAPFAAMAADPQPYRVSIQGSGVGALDMVLRASSQLVSLQDKVPIPPFALVQRARADIPRFQTALDSFGYYLNTVSIKIAGHPLDDPELASALDDFPAASPGRCFISAVSPSRAWSPKQGAPR